MNAFQIILPLFSLVGLAVPFLQIEHARHARSFMGALLGLTVLWVLLYELLRLRVLVAQTSDRMDLVMLRGYVFSAALCRLLEEVLSLRDEGKPLRPIILLLLALFFLISLGSLLLGAVGA